MKVSFATKDAYEPKLGFQEGNFDVTAAKTQVFQYPPNKESGEQSQPFLAAIITFQRTDEKGEPLDEEPQDRVLRIEKDLSRMRPGQADSRDDPDPEDLGDELDTVGNAIFGEEHSKINANTAWSVFVHSLEQRGFKPEILGEGYMPDLVGLRGHATTQKGEKRNIGGREVEPAYLVVDKITHFPYEAKPAAPVKKPAGKAAAASAAASAASPVAVGQNAGAKPNGTGASGPVAVPSPKATAGSDAAEALATEIVTELAADLAGDKRDSQKFYAMAYARLVRNKGRDRKLDAHVQALLKNQEWLALKGEELSLYTIADGVFEFGAVTV